jgi:hypothetical protein
VVKATNDYIAGGYASVSWASIGNYVYDSNAFLFTLTNPSNKPLKMAVSSLSDALFDVPSYGPTFGNGHDMHISDGSNTNTNSHISSSSYTYPNGTSGPPGGVFMVGSYNFQVAEIEVFLVT